MRAATLALVASLTACASRGAVERPSASPGIAPARASTAAPTRPRAQAWRLQFDRDDAEPVIVVRGPGAERRIALLGPGAPASAAAIEAWNDAEGIVVALADLTSPTGDRDPDAAPHPVTIEVEPSEVCPTPWLLDLDADTPRPRQRLRADPAATRVGCGRVSFADFDGEFGPERVVYYGETTFDTRIIAGQIAVLRTKIETQFGSHPASRWVTEVIIAPPQQPRPEPVGAPTPRGLRLVIDGDAGWSAPEHLEVGSTLARTWLLALLARELPSRDRGDVLELALLEGVGRGIAREAAFSLGLIDPDQYIDDLDRAEAIIAARPSAVPVDGIVDAREVAAWSAELGLQTAMLAWRLRSRGQTDVIPRRIVGARREHEGEPADALAVWRTLTADVLGAPRARAGRASLHPQIPVYEARTLGHCAQAGRVRDRNPELGLALAFAAEAGGRAVPFVAPDGAAAQAGVRAGDRLDGITVTDVELRFVVSREQQSLVLEAPPRWRDTVRPAWQRRPKTHDVDCYPPP